ncbi:MAG TPA: hypothetical protein VFX59_22400 [Polyangiales bacterium]|nr:hypothetical protein [Polyangiales bacterium]
MAVVLSALSGCGDEESSDKETSKEGGTPDSTVPGGDAGFDANVFVPPDNNLPDLPPIDNDSGAPPGAQFFAKNNPFIYLNDWPDSVYTDAYIYALAANADAKLVGVISNGIDCKCGAGDNKDSSPRREEWISAARDAGFANVPNNTSGGFGAALLRPASGVIAETVRQPTAGSALIVAEAKKASKEVPLVIVSGGPITPLADAYLADPSITQTIVVSWLAGTLKKNTATPELSLTTDYMVGDQWAAEIVLRNFRVFVYPTDLDPPIVTECRIDSDLPPSWLKDLLFQSGYFQSGRDGDGAPAVTINFPAYMKSYTRISMAPMGLETVPNPAGNIWLLTKGDAEGGGEEFFRELRKAYKVPLDAGSFKNPDGGCGP